MLKKDLELGLDLLAEALLRPTFPEDELRRKVADIQAAIQRSEENPEAVGGARARAGCSTRGTRTRIRWRARSESVGKLTREQVVALLPRALSAGRDGHRRGGRRQRGRDPREALSRRLSGWTAPASPDAP